MLMPMPADLAVASLAVAAFLIGALWREAVWRLRVGAVVERLEATRSALPPVLDLEELRERRRAFDERTGSVRGWRR